MIELALYEPEIPPNTGNIIRLCANAGVKLNLIHPLGFKLEEKSLRRAGLDYRDMVRVEEYADFDSFMNSKCERTIFAVTTKARQWHAEATFLDDSIFLLGPETRGLPESVLDKLPEEAKIRIPMLKDSRSLNLANAASIVLYESLRQNSFFDLV